MIMFNWVKGADLKKGNVFTCMAESGHALVVRVASATSKEIHVEIFTMDNVWESGGAISTKDVADMDFVRIGK